MDELNSEKRIAIRRHHNQLKVTSDGVVILGLWSIFKSFMMAISDTDTGSSEAYSDMPGGVIGLAVLFIVFLLIDFRFRLTIWRGARKEAYGRGANNRYLVFTVFLIILSITSVCLLTYNIITGRQDRYTSFASLMVETASLAIMIELVSSGLKLRKIRREIADENMEDS